jgi:hypothetical protein
MTHLSPVTQQQLRMLVVVVSCLLPLVTAPTQLFNRRAGRAVPGRRQMPRIRRIVGASSPARRFIDGRWSFMYTQALYRRVLARPPHNLVLWIDCRYDNSGLLLHRSPTHP